MKFLRMFFIISIILVIAQIGFTQSSGGKEFLIEKGKVFVPSNFDPAEKPFRLFIHLHGSFKVIIENFNKVGINGILITLQLGTLSSPYRIAFSEQEYFQSVIDTTLKILRDSINGFHFSDYDRLYITSFSAGYGGVREILKNKKYYDRINAIILADGLHTDYVGDPSEETDCKLPNPELLQGFLGFANDAVLGKKEFIVTHSEIFPGSYSSTTECSNYLLENTSTERIFSEMFYNENLIRKSYAFKNGFRTFGFYGETGPDHMQHLYNLHLFIKMLDFR